MKRYLSVLLWSISFAGCLYAFQAEEAESIVQKMVDKDRNLVSGRKHLFCQIEETIEELDEDGELEGKKTFRRITRDEPVRNYAGDNSHRLSNGKVEVSKEEPFSILKIMPRFNLKMLPDEEVDGRLCYKIHFSPKGDQPYEGREEKVANELEGVLWIDKSDFSLVKNTGRLTKPVDVAWFFVTVREIDFTFSSTLLPNGELGPKIIQYRFLVDVPPFWVFHEVHTREYLFAEDVAHFPDSSEGGLSQSSGPLNEKNSAPVSLRRP